MPIVDSILPELKREAATTRKLLLAVPDAKLAWKPHEKSMTLGELAWHLATIPSAILAMSQAERFDVGGLRRPPQPGSAAEIVTAFDGNLANAQQALAGWSDEHSLSPWRMVKGDREIVAMPRVALIRNILLNHSYHHRGQLSVYLRLLDVPVPSIYGPSADENVFG